MQNRRFTLRQKSIVVKMSPQLLWAGLRWAWLRLHSLGINLPLPAVIIAKRPTGTTPRIRLDSIFILYASLWPYMQTMHIILLLKKKNNTLCKLLEMMWNADPSPTRVAAKRDRICETEDEQRKRKMRVSKDANYWLTFVWTLLGMRIREYV